MKARFATILLAVTHISGCGTIASIGTGAGAMPLNERPKHDGPRQEIYRIDDSRYITIEGYKDCTVGGIMMWHDERSGVHSEMSPYRGSGNGVWPGRYVIDPSTQRIAVATFGCGDRTCNLWITYSNDGGVTWGGFASEQYSMYIRNKRLFPNPTELLDTDVRVTADGLIYVIPSHRHHMYRYRLDGTPNQRPESTGLTDEREGQYNSEDVTSIPDIRTPSGQERFSCDTSLNPVVPDDEQ